MITSTLATAMLAAETAAEETNTLPAEPWVFGVTALVIFGALLAVTWAFRSVAAKN